MTTTAEKTGKARGHGIGLSEREQATAFIHLCWALGEEGRGRVREHLVLHRGEHEYDSLLRALDAWIRAMESGTIRNPPTLGSYTGKP